MSRIKLRASDGSEFSFVIDVAPESVMEEWDKVRPDKDGSHGLMLLPDRRDEHIVWQIWTSSVTGWDAVDSEEPIPLPRIRPA
jgi:hypothetical protein